MGGGGRLNDGLSHVPGAGLWAAVWLDGQLDAGPGPKLGGQEWRGGYICNRHLTLNMPKKAPPSSTPPNKHGLPSGSPVTENGTPIPPFAHALILMVILMFSFSHPMRS